jgi:uncharacterized membrane protein YqjE
MNKQEQKSTDVSIGFTGLLQLLFIALKLLGKIEWSWLWVLAPTWITAIIVLLVILIILKAYK